MYIDNELVQIANNYVLASTTVPVIRGRGGRATNHLSGAVVTAGLMGNFNTSTGLSSGVFIVAKPYGGCVPASQEYTIVVNTTTGDRYKCIVDTWTPWSGPNSTLRTVTAAAATAAIANVDTTFFIADRPYMVVAITEIHNTIEDSAAAWQITKDSSTNAPGAGVDLLSTAFDLTATTRVVQTGALVTTAGYIHLKAGDRLAWDASAATDTVVNVVVTVTLMPE